MAKFGRWVAKLVSRLLATAALWVLIQTSLKIQNGPHKHRNGQHTLVRQKNLQKRDCTIEVRRGNKKQIQESSSYKLVAISSKTQKD